MVSSTRPLISSRQEMSSANFTSFWIRDFLLFPSYLDGSEVCPDRHFTSPVTAFFSKLCVVSHLIQFDSSSIWVRCACSCNGLRVSGSRITIDDHPKGPFFGTKWSLRLSCSWTNFHEMRFSQLGCLAGTFHSSTTRCERLQCGYAKGHSILWRSDVQF